MTTDYCDRHFTLCIGLLTASTAR